MKPVTEQEPNTRQFTDPMRIIVTILLNGHNIKLSPYELSLYP